MTKERREPRDREPSPLGADPLEGEEGPDGAGEGPGPGVGDLVVAPVPRVRARIGCGERVGVVLEDRRNVVKAFFPEIDRAFWVEREALASISEGRLPTAPLAVRLHRLARALAAVAIEVYDREGDADVFHVYSRGVALEDLLAARALLGGDFRRLAIEPGGVRRARVTIVFRTSPAAASGGR